MDYPLPFMPGFTARFRYCNYKGVIADRHVRPVQLWKGKTEQHPEEGWLLHAYCFDREEMRNFALKGIDQWRVVMEEAPTDADKQPFGGSAIPIDLADPEDHDAFAMSLGRGVAGLTREICERLGVPPSVAISALLTSAGSIATQTGQLGGFGGALGEMQILIESILTEDEAEDADSGSLVH